MEVKDYKPRVCDVELQEQLEASGAVEVKLGKNEEEDAAKHLIELSETIDNHLNQNYNERNRNQR